MFTLGVGIGLLILNPGGLLLGAVGLVYLIIAIAQRRLMRPWLVGVAVGLVLSSLMYLGSAVFWQFAGAPASGSGTSGP